MYLKILIPLLLLSTQAHADPYPRLPLNIVTVPLEGAPNTREAKQVFREAHKKFAEIGINLSLVKVRERFKSYDRGYLPGDDAYWEERYEGIRKNWKNYFRTRAVKRAVNIAVIPRMQFSDGPKMGGMAAGICKLPSGGIAFAAVSLQDERLKKHAPIILAHEIGHVAGASHTDDWEMSIMNPGPVKWTDAGFDLSFDTESAESMKECLRRRGYR